MKTVPVDVSKLINIVKNEVVKKTVLDKLVKKVNALTNINTSDLVKKADYNTKIEDLENKIPNHDKYTTTNEFPKLTRQNVAERLKQKNYQLKMVMLIHKKGIF